MLTLCHFSNSQAFTLFSRYIIVRFYPLEPLQPVQLDLFSFGV